ncbi:MAG: MarR family transcriptional regulator [Rhizobiaceae bacterium]
MAEDKNSSATTVTQLGIAARLARTALAERLLAHGFYAGQDQIMLALGRNEGITAGQLASELGVRPPTVTKTINRLQEQDFVERRASGIDGRQSHIYLTEKGRGALEAINRAIRKTEKRALAGLTKKERRRLHKLLHHVEDNLTADDG